MWTARPAARRETDLCNGPAKLCQALAIDRDQDGADLVTGRGGVSIVDDGVPPPEDPVVGPRVGISVATEVAWRFSVPGDPNRSKPW
jgi:DNA-3-methyladenine glycosylase